MKCCNNLEIELKNDAVEIELYNAKSDNIDITIDKNESTGQATTNNNSLYNKPVLNGIIIEGSKISDDYNIQGKMQRITNTELENIFSDL